jgi:hypothetical protein
MSEPVIDDLPGFRRRLRISPAPGQVCSELEDDLHCMAVTLQHRAGVVVAVRAEQDRAPWSTCSGAIDRIFEGLEGQPLAAAAAALGDKTRHCTHLYDLALLAAAHAHDDRPLVYDILVSDPVAGRRLSELRRDGQAVMRWTEENDRFTAPAELAGLTLMDLRDWIEALDPRAREAAKLLRWGAMLAHGRRLLVPQTTDATRFAPNCYTLQPQVARQARRVVDIRDFSRGPARPLDGRPPPPNPTSPAPAPARGEPS